MKNKKFNDLKTGFKNLDYALNGISKPCVITVGARPCMGKTTFMISMLLNFLKQNKTCFYFSFGMSSEQLVQRIFCSATETPISKLLNLEEDINKNERSKIADNFEYFIENVVESNLFISDEVVTVAEISETIKKGKGYNYKPDVIFLDYLELIPDQNETLTTKTILSEIKQIAKDNNCIIFLASQLSRNLENRKNKQPILADLKECLEYMSDIILFIYRDAYYVSYEYDKGRQKAEIIIAKNINSLPTTVKLKFKDEIPKFTD